MQKPSAKRAVVVLPEKAAGFPAEKVGQCLAEGFLLGQYTFSKYKTSKKETETFVDQIEILEPIRSRWNALEEGFKKGIKIAEGVNLARDLANTPANDMTPSRFVETAKTLFKKGSSITLEILDREKVKQLGMGAFLGVAQGSNQEPYMLILRYLSETHEKPVCLVGKGVTFDSGGISIKPALNMSEMKADMSGAAAVLGTFLALDKLKWNVNVMGVIPLCENMLSGTAQRPGDIVRAMNGKTIEIINTDAEGRLILADALCYAVSKNVKEIVDIATLTGAAIVALGETAAAVLGNRKKSVDKILKQASFTDEKLWPLPLYEEYMELLKSDVADLINCSESRLAGTCSAAKFLEQFVNNTPWIHLDIAGMMSTKKTKGYGVKGMSGFGVRTLLQYLEAQLK